MASATIVSVMAYAGLRPGEAIALSWRDVGERTLLVEQSADGLGETKETKTKTFRTVRLLAPLRRTWPHGVLDRHAPPLMPRQSSRATTAAS